MTDLVIEEVNVFIYKMLDSMGGLWLWPHSIHSGENRHRKVII